jgi:ABC-type transport system involved in multi-copper enzyme maturation permease subunit
MLRRLFLDPLAIKELSGSARRWQTYAGRGFYVAGFILILSNFSDRFTQRGVWMSQSGYAQLGRDLFREFFGLQMFLATLAAVSAASDLITKELRAGTLSILTCSPLSPGRIAFGKWKAAFAQSGMLILCGAPVFAFCVYLGGATAWDLTYSLALSFASAALGAATALYFSTRFRSGVTALLVSCGVLTVYALFPALYMDRADDSLVMLTTLTHLVRAADGAMRPRSTVFVFGWIIAVLVTGLIVLLLLRRTATRIAALALITPGPSLLHRIFTALDRFYEKISPERIRGIRLLPSRDGVWESRAVIWKELQTRASGRVRNNVRIALVLLLALAASFWVSLEYMILPVLGTTGILWLLSLSNGASLFVTEKEERKWDILLATPLTSAEILGAKLLAGVVPVLPTVITILLFWTAIYFTHHLQTEDFVVAFGSVLFPAALAYTIGAICSLKAHSLRGAFLAAS